MGQPAPECCATQLQAGHVKGGSMNCQNISSIRLKSEQARCETLEAGSGPSLVGMNAVQRSDYWLNQKNLKLQRKQEQILSDELKECTFKPQIIRKNMKIVNVDLSTKEQSVSTNTHPDRNSSSSISQRIRNSNSYTIINQLKRQRQSSPSFHRNNWSSWWVVQFI